MEFTAASDAENILQGSSGAAKSAMCGSVGLKPSDEMKGPRWYNIWSKPKHHPEELRLGQESTWPTWKETWRLVWRNFRNTWSIIFQKVRHFFRPNRVAYVSDDTLFTRYPGLEELLKDDKSIDQKIDEFIAKTQSKHHPENEDFKPGSTYNDKWNNLRQSSHNIHNIGEEVNRARRKMMIDDIEYSKKIKQMLLQKDGISNFIGVLGDRMASYQSKTLAEDQGILLENLPKDKGYLRFLLGFMGPKNVLKPFFREAIQEKLKSDELLFFGEVENFLYQLEVIQIYLACLARVHRISDPSIMPLTTKTELESLYKKQIINTEKILKGFVGTQKRLKQALDMIESMDFHKNFMRMLKSPSATSYYELQFLEPFGHLREDITAEEKNLIYREFGIESKEDHLETIKKEAPIALQNVKIFSDLHFKRKEEEINILHSITPEDLEMLSKCSMPQNDSKFKEHTI
ncbi:hypothetical protein PCASD_26251 [Puccinia coronata f. sp. avenae]|uniref:Uncharacterized protein n=1 Tax=Puccinia coronata f. sp. avenae TaxID=200324 RepID=A0A2N5TIZ6_9BASI|nr:hypothetical protein PCASD_26251 [Puccinia coronata f. sp. avenae]